MTADKMEEYYKEVGKRLRAAREKTKLSQEDVAQKSTPRIRE